MISRRQIKKHLERLAASSGRASGLVWRQFHEYVVRHYHRLDEGARAFADKMFDELDGAVQDRIASLPEGREKRRLARKFSMIRGERSPLPVVYLDTPVLENLIRLEMGQAVSGQRAQVEALFGEMEAAVRDVRAIFPEDAFHKEVLQTAGTGARPVLDLMARLSGGLSFRHGQTIEDAQVFRAIRGFAAGNDPVDCRRHWKDAFPRSTIQRILKRRSSVAFRGAVALPDQASLAPPDVDDGREGGAVRLQIRYDVKAFQEERLLQKRSARHLRELVRLGMRYRLMDDGASKNQQEGFWAAQASERPVAYWNYCGGKPQGAEGLAGFFDSLLFREIPAMKIKREVWNLLSQGHRSGWGRVTGPADVAVLSAVLPYADVVILGRDMVDVVRDKLGLDRLYDTEVYGMDEVDKVLDSLRNIPGAD